ncbi:MAG: hypothetical protein JNK48_19685 [Bryobacterales bacterium]|nr:hypothetical protein [Bryobacterales bacterium]
MDSQESGKPGVSMAMLEPAAARIWTDTEKDLALRTLDAAQWKIHLTPPLPAAWPLTRGGAIGGHWIRYAWAVNLSGAASEPFAKITFEPGDDFAVVFPLVKRITAAGYRLALPGAMNAAWVLTEAEHNRASDFPLRRPFRDNDAQAVVFARMWRGWLWSNREIEPFLEKHHPPFMHWLRAAAPPK